ncbi:MAG: hypothetical protein M1813_002942 [Trichoglossum hirsutum]|nr:MAG: hypothetical protein M1813_002942 [Trichoglossum hirsutum]
MDDSPSSSSTPTKSAYSTDPTLYLYTSLTAGSSHIITATSRIETILKANKIPFRGLDVATDEKARMLWGRRAGKRKLPGLVKMGMVVGDLEEIEDWNEYGELHEKIGEVRAPVATPSQSVTATPTNTPSKQVAPVAAASEGKPKGAVGGVPTPFTLAMRQAGEGAAEKAAEKAAEGKSSKSLMSAGAKAPTTIPETETPVPAATKETPETPRTITSESTINAKSMLPSSPPPKEDVTSHRGSTVSPASKEEIRDIEAKTAICEEDEDEDDDDNDDQEEKPTAKPASPTKPPISQPKTTEENEESSSESEEEESDEEDVIKRTPTTKPPITPQPKPTEESDEESDSDESEDEDEGKVPAKPTVTAKPSVVEPKTKESGEDESEEEEDSDNDDDDDDDDEVEEGVRPPNARPSTTAKSPTSAAAIRTQPSPATPSAETTNKN